MRLLFCLLLCIHFVGFSQKSNNYKVEHAHKLSRELNFSDAYPVWSEISDAFISKNIGEWSYVRMTLDAAEKTERYPQALYYAILLVKSKNAKKSDWTKYFELLCINNKHEQLSAAIDSALIHFPLDIEIAKWKTDLPLILERKKLVSEYSIRLINTRSNGEEYCAIPYKSGLLYVSNDDNSVNIARDYARSGQPFTDICFYDSLELSAKNPIWKKNFWIKLIYKNQWRDIKSSHTHEGPISFDSDCEMAFITRNQKDLDTINRIKYSRLELAVYKRNGKVWSQLDFPFNDKKYSTGHGVLDTNGWLIFASNRPGGFGASDLYKTRFKNNKWSEPINLGSKINSSGDELFPFVSNKGILYFSSNGWPGIGGLDVFYSSLSSDSPEAIGSPINTSADDFGIYIDETTGVGLLSSNRTDWKDQIYSIKKPVFDINVVAILKTCSGKLLTERPVVVKDLYSLKEKVYKTSKEGEISLEGLEKGKEYSFTYFGDSILTADSTVFSARKSGDFTLNLTSNYRKRVINIVALSESGKPLEGVMFNIFRKNGETSKYIATKDGSYSFTYEDKDQVDSVLIQLINHRDVVFNIPFSSLGECLDTITFPLTLKMYEGIDFIRLDMVLYNFDKYELRPEGKKELDKLVQYMKERPELRVELSSHTDSRGTYDYNIELSNNRSQSCVNYIISKGINAKMITAKGYGESKLVNHCSDGVTCSIEEHQSNRRTELRFVTPENEILDNEQLEKK